MKNFLGPMTAVLLAVSAPIARADIQITYSIDGGAAVTCDLANSAGPVSCPNVSGPPLDIVNLSANSNSPGTAASAKEFGTLLEIDNPDSVSHTIVIDLAAQGFTLPTAPPAITLSSHIGGTDNTGVPGSSISFMSCVDTTDSLAGCSGSTINSATGTPDITADGSFNDDKSGTIATLSAPYSLAQHLSLTLAASQDMNISTSTKLTSTPEPMSIVLLGGILVLTSGMIRRKRNRVS